MTIDLFGDNLRSATLPGDGFRKRQHLVRQRKLGAANLFILRPKRILCRLQHVAHCSTLEFPLTCLERQRTLAVDSLDSGVPHVVVCRGSTKKWGAAGVPTKYDIFNLFSQELPQKGLARIERRRTWYTMVPDFKILITEARV